MRDYDESCIPDGDDYEERKLEERTRAQYETQKLKAHNSPGNPEYGPAWFADEDDENYDEFDY